ncbi:D-beta-hydroxybutyrate dehydrogenase, mitochondrial-like [Protopterus annectens]|uniref:D-beta-hydroxybutyrate dehydrogenase, mitochondrial-like n=1 Tax=Protopterus annectens TaxID=7888 RepID=UPI001CFBCD4A|nr:D-beta-hydroxybutyrate dehydrogenase, mitochondrial-like [Protopterus annectens]
MLMVDKLLRPSFSLLPKAVAGVFPFKENTYRQAELVIQSCALPGNKCLYSSQTEMIENKAVLITGCDTGFGFSIAKHLHEKGFTVFAGCLLKDKGGKGCNDLDSLKSDKMQTVQLDVTKDEDVEEAIAVVKKNLKQPEEGLWGLVNNAGISTFGEVEFTSMKTYKDVAEVNLWGTIRVTKACLPLIRRAKGRVVNITSMLGRMANPARSPYCVTKFGVEAFSDCLRYEMHQWGVKVSIIEPGNFIVATNLYSPERIQAIADEMWKALPEIVKKDYGKQYFDEQTAKMKTYCGGGSQDTNGVLNDVTHALTSSSPYTRYHPMDYYWWLRMQVMTHMPAAISDRIYIY